MTAIVAPEIPAGYMRDGKGRLVPVNLVRDVDKLEDQLVKKILAFADDLNAQVARFKGHCFDDIGAFLDLLSEQYGVKPKEGTKGNMTFSSYDGCAKVQVAIADTMVFGPELQIAKALIDECIAEWAEGSRDEIRALVDHAFRPDKEGQVSREAVFSLRKIQIADERWQRAIQAINDSIRIQGSKVYLRFYRRPTPTDAWRHVTIDLASAELTPEAVAAPSARRDLAQAQAEAALLKELLAFYVADENRFLLNRGEPYGSIPTEVGAAARAATRAWPASAEVVP